MTLVLIRKDIVLEGSTTKIEDKLVLGLGSSHHRSTESNNPMVHWRWCPRGGKASGGAISSKAPMWKNESKLRGHDLVGN